LGFLEEDMYPRSISELNKKVRKEEGQMNRRNVAAEIKTVIQ
jgi:hypothetical protein